MKWKSQCHFSCYFYLFVRVLIGKYRVSIKIEVFINFIVWIMFYTCRFFFDLQMIYGFLLPIRSFCLTFILIVSINIRGHFAHSLDPPITYMHSMLVYENKILFEYFYKYIKSLGNEFNVNMLKLGLCMHIYSMKGREDILKHIKALCKQCHMGEFNDKNKEIILERIMDMIDLYFDNFCLSQYFRELEVAINKRKILLLF